MNVVPINYAEAIIEPFWDGGESYTDHKKYSVLEEYTVKYGKSALAQVSQTWSSARITIEKQGEDPQAVILSRNVNLTLGKYDTFIVFANLPTDMRMSVCCVIDGCEQSIIDTFGGKSTDEYYGHLNGSVVSSINISFCKGEIPQAVNCDLLWFGLGCREKMSELSQNTFLFDKQWPGCFEKNPIIRPQLGIFFDEIELEDLRQKLQIPLFRPAYQKYRQIALAQMNVEPEQIIGTYIPKGDPRWERRRDSGKYVVSRYMERLAFVGLIEKNEEMLRLAARMALSAAHCQFWCESIIGVFPGATWHHRSFTEDALCRSCALVLDWAGSLLTWHGKHIITDAIIMKGLPRLDADFQTVEYIRHMNQGLAFSFGRITALAALSRFYPRYEHRLAEAEADLINCIDNYIKEDGGTLEGPHYWEYSFENVLPAIYILARYFHKKPSDFQLSKIMKTADFGLTMLSVYGKGTGYIPINDSHSENMTLGIAGGMYWLSGKQEYAQLCKKLADTKESEFDIFYFIMTPSCNVADDPDNREHYRSLPITGQVSLLRHDAKLGSINFHITGGPTYYAHYHEDKGSFVLESADELLLIDRGVCSYEHNYIHEIGKAANHNLFFPESSGFEYRQPDVSAGAYVTYESYQNGVLLYAYEIKDAWQEGIFLQNTRSYFSSSPDTYLIHDEIRYCKPTNGSFRLNTYGKIEIHNRYAIIKGNTLWAWVIPIGWEPETVWSDSFGLDADLQPVNQLRLYTGNRDSLDNTTAIILSAPHAPLQPEKKLSDRLTILDSGNNFSVKCNKIIYTYSDRSFKIEK